MNSKLKILGVIPSRYASSRFPGKPLVDIHGKSMIQRVYEQAIKAKWLHNVVVATDDERILNAVNSFGGKAVFTSSQHQSGTDRCAEVLSNINENYDAVVNIQGDEPFIAPEQIDLLCSAFENEKTEIATLIKKIENVTDLHNPNRIKVVINNKGDALYFSRQAIPFQLNIPKEQWLNHYTYYKHIGIYAYRSQLLKSITQLPLSKLEKCESLEQLRWLENGYSICVKETMIESLNIDTPEDLALILKNTSL
ncbi:MAG: 3-deoxy-manno-octulosonate cytidylyltransferase [Flavobacteriales bacterium]|nr:3-deoxy-manno-octulosonate cytidylyltransferase [Flavobacteriales bacterium]